MRWGLAALAAAIVLAPLTMAAVADDAVAPEGADAKAGGGGGGAPSGGGGDD